LAVIESNKAIIYKIAKSYCSQEDNKEDLIQDIVVQLWLSFHKYDETYKLTTWIYRIALNVAISFYRKESRRDGINRGLPAEILHFQEEEAALDRQAAVEQLYGFIQELREMDRAIMLLYLEEHSQQEIAEILGLSPTNVSTKVSRIKQQLKQKFSTLKD